MKRKIFGLRKDQIFNKFVGTVHKFVILARSYVSKNARSQVSVSKNARSQVSKNARSHASKNARSHATEDLRCPETVFPKINIFEFRCYQNLDFSLYTSIKRFSNIIWLDCNDLYFIFSYKM